MMVASDGRHALLKRRGTTNLECQAKEPTSQRALRPASPSRRSCDMAEALRLHSIWCPRRTRGFCLRFASAQHALGAATQQYGRQSYGRPLCDLHPYKARKRSINTHSRQGVTLAEERSLVRRSVNVSPPLQPSYFLPASFVVHTVFKGDMGYRGTLEQLLSG